MIEPKINEVLTINGKTVKCVEETKHCYNCFYRFVNVGNNGSCEDINCCKELRKDGKDIILKIV